MTVAGGVGRSVGLSLADLAAISGQKSTDGQQACMLVSPADCLSVCLPAGTTGRRVWFIIDEVQRVGAQLILRRSRSHCVSTALPRPAAAPFVMCRTPLLRFVVDSSYNLL